MPDAPQEQGSRLPSGQFRPGVSGNPGGKPAGYSVRAAWRRRLAEDRDEDGIGKLARGLAEQLEKAVARGDMKAVRALAMAIAEAEGKPQERVEHSGTVPLTVEFVADRDPESP